MNNRYIKSPLNYTGGKHKLLPQILPLFPSEIGTFVDLFCGGANVGINVSAEKHIYNDSNQSLIGLYKVFKELDYYIVQDRIEKIISYFGLSNSNKLGYSYYGCESGSGLGKYNKEPYMNLRRYFNNLNKRDEEYYLLLFTLIVFSFNNQIRFNGKGNFNLPVGKRDFNSHIKRNLQDFIEAIHNQNCEFMSLDFLNMDISKLNNSDFVYCDPPYLITTASYNESNGWLPSDEIRLLEYLDGLNSKGIKFALSNVTMHKGRMNDILISWADKYSTHYLNYNYINSSYHGKNIEEITKEVLITNY